MQEKFNKDLRDKGWEAMSELLDREMPAQKKRRRFVFWWFFAGLLLIGLAGVAGYNYVESNEKEVTTNRPIAETKQEINNRSIGKIKTKNEEKTTVIERIKSNSPIAKKNMDKNSSPAIVNKKSTLTKKEVLSVNDSNIGRNSDVQKIESSSISKEPITNLSIDEKQKSTNDLNIQKSSAEKIEKISSLTIQKINVTNKLNSIYDSSYLVNNPVPLPVKFSTTLVGGIGIGTSQNASLGVQFSDNAGSRWIPFFGLCYRAQKFNNIGTNLKSLQENSDFLSNEFGDDLNVLPGNNFNTMVNFVSIPDVLDMHYASVNMGIQYLLSPRWSIAGGLSTDILLVTNNDLTFGGALNQDQENRSPNTNITSQDITRAKMNLVDIAPEIGFQFHLSPRWILAGSYHHGLIPIIQNSSDNHFNRFGSVRIGFRL